MSTARLGLVIALLDELRPLARRLRLRVTATAHAHGVVAGHEVVVLLSGVGHDRAAQTAERLVADHGCQGLLTAGYAGGLVPELGPGDARLVRRAVTLDGAAQQAEATWLSRCAAQGGWPAADCLSLPTMLVDREAKVAAAANTGCALVDMETAAVAAVATRRGVPWLGVRVVSDGLAEPLPRFVTRHYDPHTGQMRLFAMFGWLTLRPWEWPVLTRLAVRSRHGARVLAEAVAGAVETWA